MMLGLTLGFGGTTTLGLTLGFGAGAMILGLGGVLTGTGYGTTDGETGTGTATADCWTWGVVDTATTVVYTGFGETATGDETANIELTGGFGGCDTGEDFGD
jgi:hypothetical protein